MTNPQPPGTPRPYAAQPGQRPVQPKPKKKGNAALLWCSIISTVLTPLTFLVALTALLLPWFLFLLGGGGQVERFDQEFAPWFTTGWITLIVSVVLLIATIVLWVLYARSRKPVSQTTEQH